jgi:signal transduction histidine kinase
MHPGIRIEKDIAIQEDDVPDPLKIVIYRILQEATSNVARHSRANRVHLSLKEEAGCLELRIHDNGVGFDPEDLTSPERLDRGLGVTSMKERAELSNGTFWVDARQGAGTTIRASWKRS